MKKNMGSTDKLIRLAIAIVLIVLYMTHKLPETWDIVALVVALIFTITWIFRIKTPAFSG